MRTHLKPWPLVPYRNGVDYTADEVAKEIGYTVSDGAVDHARAIKEYAMANVLEVSDAIAGAGPRGDTSRCMDFNKGYRAAFSIIQVGAERYRSLTVLAPLGEGEMQVTAVAICIARQLFDFGNDPQQWDGHGSVCDCHGVTVVISESVAPVSVN